MIVKYQRDVSGKEFLGQPHKSVTLLGMSGVGKTTLAERLPKTSWFHYSGDYRIGTRYLDEAILDEIKHHAMKDPLLGNLLRTDAIYIEHNITVDNLDLVSQFLGMIGNTDNGGLALEEFRRRQALHREAEIAAMSDVHDFITRARQIYGYPHFINDAGGSLCELDDERLMARLASDTLIIYLRPSDELLEQIVKRSLDRPKPMYYADAFLSRVLPGYLTETGIESVEEIHPENFFRWLFPRLIEHREPLYRRIADEYGITVDAHELMSVDGEDGFLEIVAATLDRR